MATKTKNKTTFDTINEVAQQAGLVLMTAALTLSLIEMPEHSGRMIVPNQPALALAGQQGGEDNTNQIRREREEPAPHYVSYGINQRTPSRARSL